MGLNFQGMKICKSLSGNDQFEMSYGVLLRHQPIKTKNISHKKMKICKTPFQILLATRVTFFGSIVKSQDWPSERENNGFPLRYNVCQ